MAPRRMSGRLGGSGSARTVWRICHLTRRVQDGLIGIKHCERKSQITLIGILKKSDAFITNELGSTELHRKHTVRLESEDGLFLRSRVIDQRLIDRIFNEKLIDVDQYDAACSFHALAYRAGMFPASIKLERVQMSVVDRAPRALAIMSVDRYLQRNCDPRAYQAVWLTVVREHKSPITHLRMGLNTLKTYFNPTLTPGSRRSPDSVRATMERAEKALEAAHLEPAPLQGP